MKNLYILILLTLISCTQNTEKKKEPLKTQDAVELVIDPPKKVDGVSFNELLEELRSKTVPLIDSTSFDTFIEERKIYNKEEVLILQLEKIYPNYYKEGYNYRATPNYKMELSKNFHSVVIAIYKGDHEMESILINYDLTGKMIDFKIISYDEIAEGWSRIESKIEQNKLMVKNIFWMDEKQKTIELFEINVEGKIKPITSTNTDSSPNDLILINNVIQQLNLDKFKIKTNLILAKVQPNNPEETIILIPEIVDEGEHYLELNSYILIVNSATGEITHKYFESSKTNHWLSDAVELREIKIDTAPYIITENIRAFGIRVYYYGMSRANPYSNEAISLFIKSGNMLKKILKNYDVMNYGGEWVTNCTGEFLEDKKTFIITANKTNSYYDILVRNKITETTNYEDESGNCDYNEKITIEKVLLKFNGEEYEEKNQVFK